MKLEYNFTKEEIQAVKEAIQKNDLNCCKFVLNNLADAIVSLIKEES